MKKTILLFGVLSFLTFKNQAQTTVTDYDGNVYNTVTIGTQVWMKENLKVTHYLNGDLIPNIPDSAAWGVLTTGAFSFNPYVCYPGAYYNCYAVKDARKICPIGWYVPSDGEWNIMEKFIDNTVDTAAFNWRGTDIGIKLKVQDFWLYDNSSTNSSGFTAHGGGYRNKDGALVGALQYGYWWSSTQDPWWEGFGKSYVFSRALYFSSNRMDRNSYIYSYGFSVRCIKDKDYQINDNHIEKYIQIYPNPATDRLYIDCTERQKLKMQVYNIIGDCVFHSVLTNGTNEIDISSLTSGIYIIRLTGADGTYQQKLIKN